MHLAKASTPFHWLLIVVAGVFFASATACGGDEAVQCTDICDELDTCFEDFDVTQCVDRCEEEAQADIDICNDCLDSSEMECTDCTGDTCSLFIGGGMTSEL